MRGLTKFGLALVLGCALASLSAGPAFAEHLWGRVFKDGNQDQEYSPIQDDLLPGVPVRLDRLVVDSRGNETWIEGYRVRTTSEDGLFNFSQPAPLDPNNPGQPQLEVDQAAPEEGTYRVVLPQLDFYVPPPPGPGELPLLDPGQIFTAPHVVTNGEVKPPASSPETDPFKLRNPESGPPLLPMGSDPAIPPSDFPLTTGVPEGGDDCNTFGDVAGITFMDRGLCNAVLDEADARAPAVTVRLEFVDPVSETLEMKSLADGRFSFDYALELLEATEITIRVSFQFPDGSFGYYQDDPDSDDLLKKDYLEIKVDHSDPGTWCFPTPNLAVGCEKSGTLNGTVFSDTNGDGIHDSDSEPGIAGITVELLKLDGSSLGSTSTDGSGLYGFTGLGAGLIQVVARGTGATPDPARGATVGAAPATVDLPVPFSEEEPGDCERDACTEGALHEVVVEAEVWVGDLVSSVAAHAILYTDCDGDEALDIASQGYQGTTFPSPAAGYQDVVHIQDVRFSTGWATIQVRLAADPSAFPSGSFGCTKRKLEVSVNGRRISACMSFRCDSVQAGSRFPGAAGPFRVLSTWSRASWLECKGLTLPEPPSGDCDVDGNPGDGGTPGDGGNPGDGGGDGEMCEKSARVPVAKRAPRLKRSWGRRAHSRRAHSRRAHSRRAHSGRAPTRRASSRRAHSRKARSRSARGRSLRAKASRGRSVSQMRSSYSRSRSAEQSRGAQKKSYKTRRRMQSRQRGMHRSRRHR